MTDLVEFIEGLRDGYGITDPGFMKDAAKFLVSNCWFGCRPAAENGMLLAEDSDAQKIGKKLEPFCENYGESDLEKYRYLISEIARIMPKTAGILRKYADDVALEETAAKNLADFILEFLPGEITECTDPEIASLVDKGFDELPRVYGDILTDFINWTNDHEKTMYYSRYFMNAYSDRSAESSAYDEHSYLQILYHLYNSAYIEENNMYARAADSKNYVDTWLFLSLHFLCALRTTDLVRLPHPRLPEKDPKEILDMIREGMFPEAAARTAVYSVIWHLDALASPPNKTKMTQGIGSIKLVIPESVEVHIGTLFAAAEAHFRLSGANPAAPLIRNISTYQQINRYMGDEIGDLFLDANFRSRAANKSYMQMVYLLTDDILGINDEFHVKGYMLAALARSHKGSYGQFAQTTVKYLKDAKMSGFTPEFVIKELFERGVLSMIPSMLLKMIRGKDYEKLSVKSQTQMIKGLDMTPAEVERSVAVMQKTMKESDRAAHAIYATHTPEEIVSILHRIGSGEAVSKNANSLCLATAMGKACPFMGRHTCIGCEHEIGTKATMFLMVNETKRLQEKCKNADSLMEKSRCRAIARDVVIPAIDRMLQAVEENYGSDALHTLEKIISEAL